MAANIEELKRKFYMNQYDNYLSYLRSWNYSEDNDYSFNLKRVFGSSYESKFSKIKDNGKVVHYHHAVTDIIANESQQWASVDEFFDIISRDQSITEHVNNLVDYINSGALKNKNETKIQSEDSIIKLIANYFCEQNGIEDKPITKTRDAARDNENIEIKGEKGNTTITDPELKKLFKIITNSTLKNELNEKSTFSNVMDIIKKHLFFKGSHDSLDWNLSNSVQYLQAVKDLRNNQFHHVVEMIQQHGAAPQVVLRFVLFTYIHVVLALRMSMVKWGKGNYPQRPVTLRVYRDKRHSWKSLGVKLYRIESGKGVKINEVPSGSKNTKTYEVYRFNTYEIKVNEGASCYLEIGPKCFNPVAVADKVTPRFYQSVTEAKSSDSTIFTENYYDESLRNLNGIKKDTEQIRDKLTTIENISIEIGENITEIKDVITDRIEEQRREEEKTKATKRKRIILSAIFLIFVTIMGIVFYINSFCEYSQNVPKSYESKKNTNALISIGDSLLNIAWDKDYRLSEQVGQTYREAIGQLRKLAEQHNSGASIDLCYLYLSGKGCYNLDSAFYYAQKKEVRETKEGQGLYAYLLLKRGEAELARKEFLRAIDPEEPYICLTKALYDIQNSINNQTTMQASKQTCESAYQSLTSINNDDAIFEKAMIDLWGIRDREDEFLIHPNFGKAFNALCGLASRNPYTILVLGDIYNLMGDLGTGLTFHGAAFYCGIQEKAAIAINSSLILHPDVFSLTDKGRAIKEIAAGKTNVIGGIGGILSNYVHFIDGKAFDLAIKEADSLFYISQQKTGDISFSDTSFISRIRITSRLMTGKSDDFSEAVRLAMQRDNCTDSIAVANYLKGVCLAKGYGCKKDISKSDALILSSAERRTYTESLYTIIKRFPPVFYPDSTTKYWFSEADLNRVLSYNSPKLACAVMDAIINDSIAKRIYEKNIPALASWLPKEVRLMSDLIDKCNKYFNNESISGYQIAEFNKIVEGVNDYICYAMNNGNIQMAKIGCTFYEATVNTFILSSNLNSYEKSILSSNKRSYEGFSIPLKDGNNTLPNIIPSFPDYAY